MRIGSGMFTGSYSRAPVMQTTGRFQLLTNTNDTTGRFDGYSRTPMIETKGEYKGYSRTPMKETTGEYKGYS